MVKCNQRNWKYRLIVTLLTVITSVQSSRALVITEIMYNPIDGQLEYIELYNHRAVTEDLGGYAFTRGIEYAFAPGTRLGAHQYLVIALDPNALRDAHNLTTVLGPYTGRLSNSGERIDLSNANGGILLSVRYRDDAPWPIAPDGTGHSLTLCRISADPDEGSSWRASTLIGGTPGLAPVVPDESAGLRINELLADQSTPDGADWLELYNAGSGPMDLTHVYLSDDPANLLKYKLPDSLQLQSGEHWATDLAAGDLDGAFGLKASGETVFVTQGSVGASPTAVRVLDAIRFDALPPDVTLGRAPDGSNRLCLLETPSKAADNASPLIHDIVINEIMYHHGLREDRYEYVELYNRGTEPVSLEDWAFTDGIDYAFPAGTVLAPDDYLVVAKDPNLLADLYETLERGSNLVGPFTGTLDDRTERVRLAYPQYVPDPNSGEPEIRLITADEVTYYEGGRWPAWADGQGASLELRDPHSDNDAPDAWAASNESAKSAWAPFSFTVNNSDNTYTHDRVSVFGMMLLNRGEVLLDDIQLTIGGQSRLQNGGFESGVTSWRVQGNHVQSHVTTDAQQTGARCLKLVATGHGDPGANRINQKISNVTASTVTFSGRAKWLKGSRYLLLRTSRERSPVQPPRPSHAFELAMPLDLGTPGTVNTAFAANRGPDISEVQHRPTLPKAGQPIVVTARVTDTGTVQSVILKYRSEGQGQFSSQTMLDDGRGEDAVAHDGVYTGIIPAAGSGTMRAFRILATNGLAMELFPQPLAPSADVPVRTCLVRVGDTNVNSQLARYRVWLSNDVIDTFRGRSNLSNELMDCTFVYNGTDVFYNAQIRFRGSPFLRGGSGRDPRGRYGYRIKFNPEKRLGRRAEINLDNTEGGNRGPLQERASYWFYRQMGLPYSEQEFIRLVINGQSHSKYEDVQKIDGDYIDAWFPDDSDGYIHKVDDYFEFNVQGTSHSNYDEGLKYDSKHPLNPETYRWGFEKRSHRDNDTWDHLFRFAVSMNVPSSDPTYEQAVESVVDPDYLARVLAIRHAVGDWDSYGFDRGKNNYFYYAAQADKWYLLPWDIDFTLGSGRGPTTNLFSVSGGKFPEVRQFLNTPKYREMYLNAYSELISGPWRTSYGTDDPPTAFDRFLDNAADALIADGVGSGRRDGIKQYVKSRRDYILTQVPAIEFSATVNGGDALMTTEERIVIQGVAPVDVVALRINGEVVPIVFTSKFNFEAEFSVPVGPHFVSILGLDQAGFPVPGAEDTLIIVRMQSTRVDSVAPNPVSRQAGEVSLTVTGSGFVPGLGTTVQLTQGSNELGFDVKYVQHSQAFDRIDAATLLLDDVTHPEDTFYGTHEWINLSHGPGQGEFPNNELSFLDPFDLGGTNYAIRFSGFLVVPSAGIRYFGVNSDDGFSLRISGQLVGEYADARAATTTDVTKNRTAGTMSVDFPAAGRYPLVIDFYENGGGEAIEFFQTDAGGANRRLINVDAELTVVRGTAKTLEATDVVGTDAQTITCTVDLTDADPGQWDVVVTPPAGLAAPSVLKDGLEILE